MKTFVTIAIFLCVGTISGWSLEKRGCHGCSAGKLMLQCDYYVARKGDLSHRDDCAAYAEAVDVDGASAKAAWYYLLAGRPHQALDAARRALAVGQTFAAGYAAQAEMVLGYPRRALHFMAQFHEKVKDDTYFKKELITLRRLYPTVDFDRLTR